MYNPRSSYHETLATNILCNLPMPDRREISETPSFLFPGGGVVVGRPLVHGNRDLVSSDINTPILKRLSADMQELVCTLSATQES